MTERTVPLSSRSVDRPTSMLCDSIPSRVEVAASNNTEYFFESALLFGHNTGDQRALSFRLHNEETGE